MRAEGVHHDAAPTPDLALALATCAADHYIIALLRAVPDRLA